MASKAFLIAIVIAVIAAPTVFAIDYIVGDDSGWTLGFDYAAWAEGKEFYVGDRLLFKYTVGAHNVYKVNGTGFQQCVVPPPSEALTSGDDAITLATPGRKWYICGVGNHCASGMKLVISVSSAGPAPSPSPTYGAPLMQGKKPLSSWSNWKLKIHF